jgi:hypothetical protein
MEVHDFRPDSRPCIGTGRIEVRFKRFRDIDHEHISVGFQDLLYERQIFSQNQCIYVAHGPKRGILVYKSAEICSLEESERKLLVRTCFCDAADTGFMYEILQAALVVVFTECDEKGFR